MTRKYEDELKRMKNQSDESATAITSDTARCMTIKESKFIQKLEKLDNRTSIIPALLNSHND
jgi:Mn-dependent DtxR family transcriptional regulator